MDDVVVAKNHNPFAVNDVVFTKVTGYDWRKLNTTGCSLVWGHPQGPTLTRVLIEALEEAVDLGGGHVLIFGCAAGDVGIAALFKVTGRRSLVTPTAPQPLAVARRRRRRAGDATTDPRGAGPRQRHDIFSKGALPAAAAALVDQVFGEAGARGALVISGANGIVGAGKTMQLGSRLEPLRRARGGARLPRRARRHRPAVSRAWCRRSGARARRAS